MALVQYLFEGGSEGLTATNANCGSSTASVVGGTHVFAANAKAHGNLGLRITNASNTSSFRRFAFAGGVATTVFQFSGVVTMPSQAPLQDTALCRFVEANGNGRLSVSVNAAGQIAVGDYQSTHYVTIANIVWGEKYRITVEAVGGSTTASQVSVGVYSGTSSWSVPIGTPLSVSNWNMSSDSLIGVDIGLAGPPGAIVLTVGWDDVQLNDGVGSRIDDIADRLSTPIVSLGASTSPTTTGGSNGAQVVTWPVVAGANSYEAWIASGSSPSQGDFVLVASGVTSPYTFTGLTAGEWSYGIKAKVS